MISKGCPEASAAARMEASARGSSCSSLYAGTMKESIVSTVAAVCDRRIPHLENDSAVIDRRFSSWRRGLLIESDVFVARRAESIEHPGVLERLNSVRNVARQIVGVARAQLVRAPIREHLHPPRENVNDLLLWMLVLRHLAAGFQLGQHLIHRFAMRDGAPPNPRTDLNPRIFLC